MIVSNRIAEVLRERRKTQRWLAQRVEMDQAQLSRIIMGRQGVRIQTGERIAAALGLSVEDLWPGGYRMRDHRPT